MSEIQSISQGNYILQGTVATSAGIVGDGTTQNPLRADETVLWENSANKLTKDITWPQTLSEPITNFEKVSFLYAADAVRQDAQYHIFDAYNNYNYNLVDWRCDGPTSDNIFWREAKFNCNGTSLTNPYNSTINLSTAFAGGGFNKNGYNFLIKVIGINRKAQ